MTFIATSLCAVVTCLALVAGCQTQTATDAPATSGSRAKTDVQQKAAGPLPDSGFKAEIIALHAPERLRPGQVSVINIKVKNTSDVIWWQGGGETTDRTDNKFYIAAGNKWVHKNGMMTSETEGHNGIPKDLKPGGEIEMSLKITAPGKPGEWIMELDMVQEGVAWFHEKGSPTTRVKVKVVN